MTKEYIISIVCEVCGVTAEEIRHCTAMPPKSVSYARYLIAYNACFRHGRYMFGEIAADIGTNTRTLYERASPRAIRARRYKDFAFASLYNQVEARLSRKTPVGVAL